MPVAAKWPPLAFLRAAAAPAGPCCRDGGGHRLGLVGGQHAVGEPRVAREKRAVQVRAVHALEAAALVPGGAVVTEAGQHPAEGLGAFVEIRAPGMVLEAGERPAGPLAL